MLRQRGDVARSREFSGACVLIAAFVILTTAGPHAIDRLAGLMRDVCKTAASGGDAQFILRQGVRAAAELLGVFFASVVSVAFLAGLAQVGPRFVPAAVYPDFARLLRDRARSTGPSLTGVSVGAAKVLVIALAIAAICVWCLRDQAHSFAYVVARPPTVIGGFAAAMLHTVAVPVLVAVAVLAICDLAHAKWSWWVRNRMTRQEVLADVRAEQGDPRIRRARQRMHRELIGPASTGNADSTSSARPESPK